jgi:hypothetical protein
MVQNLLKNRESEKLWFALSAGASYPLAIHIGEGRLFSI